MNSYSDPENGNEILEQFHNSDTEQEAENIINKYFPNWIVCSLPRYSKDYSYLDRNWQNLCTKLETTKKKIVLVQNIFFDSQHSVINKIAETLTKRGYVVRRVDEFSYCPVCVSAIPAIEVWHLMKEKNLPVPESWAAKCKDC